MEDRSSTALSGWFKELRDRVCRLTLSHAVGVECS